MTTLQLVPHIAQPDTEPQHTCGRPWCDAYWADVRMHSSPVEEVPGTGMMATVFQYDNDRSPMIELNTLHGNHWMTPGEAACLAGILLHVAGLADPEIAAPKTASDPDVDVLADVLTLGLEKYARLPF